MTSIKNILSAMGIVFFVASCGISGETGETSDQERAAAIDEICEVSPVDCEAAHELLYAVDFAEQGNSCPAHCQNLCRGSNNPNCERNCRKKLCE